MQEAVAEDIEVVPTLHELCMEVLVDAVLDGRVEDIVAKSSNIPLPQLQSIWQSASDEGGEVDDVTLLTLLQAADMEHAQPEVALSSLTQVTMSAVATLIQLGVRRLRCIKCPSVVRTPPSDLAGGEGAPTLQHLVLSGCCMPHLGMHADQLATAQLRGALEACRATLQVALLDNDSWASPPLDLTLPWPGLQALDLSGSSLTELPCCPTALPCLTELSLGGASELSLSDVAAVLRAAPQLRSVNLQGTCVTWKCLFECLASTVSQLDLSGCRALGALPEGAGSALPHLASLNVSDTEMNGLGVGDILAAFPCLESLDVSDNANLTSADLGLALHAASVASGEGQFALQMLSIANTGATEPAVRHAVAVAAVSGGAGPESVRCSPPQPEFMHALTISVRAQRRFWKVM